MKSRRLKSRSNLPEAIFAAGFVLAVLGAVNFVSGTSAADTAQPVVTSNAQRNVAIEEALKSGKKTYQFETNFIPGIGNVSDPDAYKKQFEEQSIQENTP